ncbi:cupin [Phyllobacterium phragmitis]|uniref:Cupin n=1 Tax=Phyllobacterium phragmitis TaxID=2670329 RepID=A0A2S9IWM7_9HYPH|nr:cupin domain-containing protein [Phyllobacterium phragmitis]PRD44932.1 cupin [Phyllobacterium phragmitis]
MTDRQDALPWVETGGGVSRRVLSHTPEVMLVEFRFGPDGFGTPHHHPHIQATYVREGRFEFTIDGVAHIIAAGDTLIVPSNAVHSCRALEPGTLIDVFTPRRDDFL